MERLPPLNFPSVDLRIRRGPDDRLYIPDMIRGGYLVLTPEEWVRRHLINYLVSSCGIELRSIVTEYPVMLNGTAQRADVVVVNREGGVVLLAECKAADVRIDDTVLSQAVRYNAVLQARYIIITNGLQHFCWEHRPDGCYVQLRDFPRNI